MSGRCGGRSELQSCSCWPLCGGGRPRPPGGRGARHHTLPREVFGDRERRRSTNQQREKVNRVVWKMSNPSGRDAKGEIDIRLRRRELARQPPQREVGCERIPGAAPRNAEEAYTIDSDDEGADVCEGRGRHELA